jgi:hypothetical protein
MLSELSTKTATLYTLQVNVILQNIDRFFPNRTYCILCRHDTRHRLDRTNLNMRQYQSYFNISRTSTSVVLQHQSYFNISRTSTSVVLQHQSYFNISRTSTSVLLQHQLFFNMSSASLKHSYCSSMIGVQDISPATYTASPSRCHEDN